MRKADRGRFYQGIVISLKRGFVPALRLSAWYDFSPQLPARPADRRTGKCLTNSEVRRADPDPTSELWYQHDRLLRYNTPLPRVGSTWRLNEKWSASASIATVVWARVNHDLKYACDFQLIRDFRVDGENPQPCPQPSPR